MDDTNILPATHAGLGHDGQHGHTFASRYTSQTSIPKYKIPSQGAPSDTIYQMIKDELDLDGRPTLNLASFVNTWMEPSAEKLVVDNLAKNLADADQYPAIMQIHRRVVSILAHLWGVQKGEEAIGTACTGSSEGIHLGGLAMKRRWQEKRRAEGKDASRPNILMGSNAQVALEKFACYFDVEARVLPVSAESHFRLNPDLVRENVDENTIGIFVILGSTYTGHFEPVEEVARILDQHQQETGQDVPIHVDAASGGFVAPFTHAKAGGAKWDFELPRVKSINASGHKYGLCCPGIGWVVWRDESYLPEDLIFTLDYLGGEEKSFTLNFSRPGAQVIVQYFNLIHLGFSGYREVMEDCLANTRTLAVSLEKTGWFRVLSDTHRRAPRSDSDNASKITLDPSAVASRAKSSFQKVADSLGGDGTAAHVMEQTSADFVPGLPVVCFCFSDKFKEQFPHITQDTLSLLLRARQWILPNYSLPPGEDDTKVLRVTIRESMSYDLISRLLEDICESMERMMESDQLDLSILQKQRRAVTLKDVQGGPSLKDVKRGFQQAARGVYKGVC